MILTPSDAFVLDFSVAVVKASTDNGRRMVEVEASNENVDQEGDVILQDALLNSAGAFIKSGALDIDHLSEFGERMGIPNPASFVIGRPTEVKDLGDKRTSVIGEISKSRDGISRPQQYKFDEFWDSLQCDPPVRWRASVYGFPTPDGIVKCQETDECTHGAKRFLIKGFIWKSLAFTRRPQNDTLASPAKIITAKAYMGELSKIYPRNVDTMMDAWNLRECEDCMAHAYPTTVAFRNHFAKCVGLPEGQSEILANAVMNFNRRFGKK